jgi:hypothetical protein
MLTAVAMRQRVHLGDGAFALGLMKNPRRDVYLALDAFAWLVASMLSAQIAEKATAEAIRLSWKAAAEVIRISSTGWLNVLVLVEDHWDSYERGEIPEMIIGVGVTRGKSGRVEVGPKAEVEAKLAGYEVIRGVSINRALRQFYANSRETGVPLPPRLTLPEDHPDHARWRQELEEYRKCGEQKYEAKIKMRRARRAAATFELSPRETA